MKKPSIYLITDGQKLRKQGSLLERIEQAFVASNGYISHLQVREQVVGESPSTDQELISIINDLKPLCERHLVKLILNSRVDLVQEMNLDGVHLGANTISIAAARSKLNDKIIGFSAHNRKEVEQSFNQGVDYIFLSPVFKPLSKTSLRLELGLEELGKMCDEFPEREIYALGGIDKSNAKSCIDAGASGVAMISSILLADDVREAVCRFVSELKKP